ncbi:TPA: ComEC/Rec2 family competence protein [Photobacterium damselae]
MYQVIKFGIIFCALAVISPTSYANIKIRIVDVGAGLCVLSSDTVENKHFLYDAGRWDNNLCSDYVNEVIDNTELSLVVISHPDADHLSNLKYILQRNKTNMIIHTGYERYRVSNWRVANHAISEAAQAGATVINLHSTTIESINPIIPIGNMTVELIYGLGEWDQTDSNRRLSENERRNAISISLKLTAYNKSVFFSGDLVGRHERDPIEACKFSESDIINSQKLIKSDVLIAPHHGANNASSQCLLNAISPSYIVFSAGHKYEHPRKKTVERILATLDLQENTHLFRTDRGDDEGNKEWDYLRINNCKDKPGDDDIEIIFAPDSSLTIGYIEEHNTCD